MVDLKVTEFMITAFMFTPRVCARGEVIELVFLSPKKFAPFMTYKHSRNFGFCVHAIPTHGVYDYRILQFLFQLNTL